MHGVRARVGLRNTAPFAPDEATIAAGGYNIT